MRRRPPAPLPHAWTRYACLDLVNSRWTDHLGSGEVHDRLPLPEWRAAFLDRWGLRPLEGPGEPGVAELAALRSLLRRLLEAFARRQALPATDVEALNRVLARSPLTRRLEPAEGDAGTAPPRAGGHRLLEAPARRGREWALAEIAASAARLLAEGDPARLRICANPACSWMFYDESRNGSRRWCQGAVCGSLVKVRRFRARGPARAGRGARRGASSSDPDP
ncbi:MAG TPA: ABATE domain-containing protein [Candidatus Dormibacteraeota bacterium]|nr:ABATE domain-containing protein [Candidatus Dormibacteraeota bacterium]